MLWLVPLLPVLASVLLYPWWKVSPSRPAMALSAMVVVLATLALVAWGAGAGWGGQLGWSDRLQLELGLTPLTTVAALVVPLVAAPIIGFAASHERERLPRLVALMVAFTGVMELLVLARDLLTLLIAWEIVGALSWALIGHQFQDRERGRHASQAFLTTRTGDLGLYIAAFVVFQQTGTLAYDSLGQMSPAATSVFAAGVTLAALSKSAQLPFAPWLFSAMSGPAPVSALLHAATMVAAGVLLLMQLQPILQGVPWFGPALMTVGLATAICGGLVASSSGHAKQLLAGSTSAHYGLMFVAVAAGYPAVALVHFALHGVMKAPLFLITGAAGHQAGGYELHRIAATPVSRALRLAGLVAVLALAGLPPLGAAWSKEQVMAAAAHSGLLPAFLVALAGGLSAFYAGRWQAAFQAGAGRAGQAADADSVVARGGVYVLVLLVVLASPVWLPGSKALLGDWLASAFPTARWWELALSLALVLLGLFLGYRFSAQQLAAGSGTATWQRFLAQWLMLPGLAQRTIVRPVDAVAVRLATLDDRAVDAGVRATAGLGDWLAGAGTRAGEWLLDGLPEGLARLSGRAGRGIVQLQSGMTHHYYSTIAVGVIAMAVILVLGLLTGGSS